MLDVSKSYGYKDQTLALYAREFDQQVSFEVRDKQGNITGEYMYAYVPSSDKNKFKKFGDRWKVPSSYFRKSPDNSFKEDEIVDKVDVNKEVLLKLTQSSIAHGGVKYTLECFSELEKLAAKIK